jgi:hypothetical protein
MGLATWGAAIGSESATRMDAFILEIAPIVKDIFRYFAEI